MEELDVVAMIREFFEEVNCKCGPVTKNTDSEFYITSAFNRKYRVYVNNLCARVNLVTPRGESPIVKVNLEKPNSLEILKEKAEVLAAMRNGPTIPGLNLPEVDFNLF